MEMGTGGNVHRHLQSDQTGATAVTHLEQPTMENATQVVASHSTVSTTCDAGIPRVAERTVVATTAGDVGLTDTADPSRSTTVCRLLGELSSRTTVADWYLYCIRTIWQVHGTEEGAPDGVLERASKSKASYGPAFRHLLVNLTAMGLGDSRLDQLTPTQVVTVLYRMAKNSMGRAACSISAWALLPPICSPPISDISVIRVRRWLERHRSSARYDAFFDFEEFLKRLVIRQINWNDELEVRAQLVTVLRVILLARGCDVATTLLKYETTTKNGVEIRWIQVRRKGEQRYRKEPLSRSHQPAMCPLRLWDAYVRLSNPRRGMVMREDKDYLLITYRPYKRRGDASPTHHHLSAERLRSDVQNVMKDCGVNTDEYKSNSLRGAAASYLCSRHVDMHLVMGRAGWRTVGIFMRHYCRSFASVNWTQMMQNAAQGDRAAFQRAMDGIWDETSQIDGLTVGSDIRVNDFPRREAAPTPTSSTADTAVDRDPMTSVRCVTKHDEGSREVHTVTRNRVTVHCLRFSLSANNSRIRHPDPPRPNRPPAGSSRPISFSPRPSGRRKRTKRTAEDRGRSV